MRSGWLVVGWVAASAVRRLSRRTGVTDAEAFGSLPGDEVIAHPMVEWGCPALTDRAGGSVRLPA
jgi:hypothetical protein